MSLTYKQILWIFILLLIPIAVFSQASKYHYIPPLAASSGGNADDMGNQYFYITTASTESVTYTIYPLPISSATSFTGVISKLLPGDLKYDNVNRYLANTGGNNGAGYGQLFVRENETALALNDKGFYIEASAPIYVNVRYRANAQASGLVSKGQAALGRSFRTGGFTNARPTDTHYMNFASVMAVEA